MSSTLMKKQYKSFELKDVYCDFCKKQLKDKNKEFYAGGTISFNFGYGSELDDALGCFTSMHICDKCFKKKFLKYYDEFRCLKLENKLRGRGK